MTLTLQISDKAIDSVELDIPDDELVNAWRLVQLQRENLFLKNFDKILNEQTAPVFYVVVESRMNQIINEEQLMEAI